MESERNTDYSEKDSSKNNFYEGITSLGKKAVRFGAATAIGLASYLSSSAHAADQDRDGLDDAYETGVSLTSISTADLNSDGIMDGYDTDNDGYNDGIELRNSTSFDGEPLDSARPDWNQPGYQIEDVAAYLAQDGTSHKLMPALSRDGTKLAYIKTDTNYANPRLAIISDISSPVETELVNLNDFDLKQPVFDKTGRYLFYHDEPLGDNTRVNLFRYDLNDDSITQLTTVASGERIGHPFTVTYPASSSLVQKDWIFYTDWNFQASGVSQIAASPINSGTPDFNTKVAIADMNDGGSLSGLEEMPRLDIDGDTILFATTRSNTESGTFIATGVEDILLGNTSAYNSLLDSRIDRAGFGGPGIVSLPIGVSPTGNAFYVSIDDSGQFDRSLLDFSNTDFDLLVGGFLSGATVGRINIPFVGNQLSGVASIDGTRIIYSSDDDFSSTTTKNLYEGAIASLNRVPAASSGTLVEEFRLIDPSGVSLVLPTDSNYTLPGATPNGTIKSKSLSLAERLVQNQLVANREFEPSGATFTGNGSRGVLGTPRFEYEYLQSEIDADLLDEGTLDVHEADPNTGEPLEPALNVLARDTTNNVISVEVAGFSDYGIKGISTLDTDQDLYPDQSEINHDGNPGYNPFHPVNNPTGTDTDINDSDTDDDGVIDGTEVQLGTDPLNANDFPTLPLSPWSKVATVIGAGIIGAYALSNRVRTRFKKSRTNGLERKLI